MRPVITRRSMRAEDAPFLYRLYASTRASEMELTGWPGEEQEAFLQMQFRAQSTDYARNYPDAAFDVLWEGAQAVGRLYLDRREREIRIVDIALVPEARGRGIGTGLLTEILAEAEGAGKRVTIHVETNNPAMRLYRRLGFVPVDENGIYHLMEWSVPKAVQTD